jgi:hypothetical protein
LDASDNCQALQLGREVLPFLAVNGEFLHVGWQLLSRLDLFSGFLGGDSLN